MKNTFEYSKRNTLGIKAALIFKRKLWYFGYTTFFCFVDSCDHVHMHFWTLHAMMTCGLSVYIQNFSGTWFYQSFPTRQGQSEEELHKIKYKTLFRNSQFSQEIGRNFKVKWFVRLPGFWKYKQAIYFRSPLEFTKSILWRTEWASNHRIFLLPQYQFE